MAVRGQWRPMPIGMRLRERRSHSHFNPFAMLLLLNALFPSFSKPKIFSYNRIYSWMKYEDNWGASSAVGLWVDAGTIVYLYAISFASISDFHLSDFHVEGVKALRI